MNVAVLNAQIPFVRGGAEVLAEGLVAALERAGHQVELICVPFTGHPAEAVLDHLLGARLTRIADAERVIALKFPLYCIDHPGMVVWLVHQHRAFHELWGRSELGTEDTAANRAVRDSVRRSEREILSGLPRFAISNVVRERLLSSTGLDATVLHPPMPARPGLLPGPPGDYIFFPGRVSWLKRHPLAVKAMRQVRSDVRLVIAGPVSEQHAGLELKALLAGSRLGSRVNFIDRWVSDEEQARLYSGALAVVVPAFDEEYGLVVLEAFAAGRPVVTCVDSGAPATLVEHERSGLIVAPEPASLARAFDRLHVEPKLVASLAAGALQRLEALDLSWERTITTLLG